MLQYVLSVFCPSVCLFVCYFVPHFIEDSTSLNFTNELQVFWLNLSGLLFISLSCLPPSPSVWDPLYMYVSSLSAGTQRCWQIDDGCEGEGGGDGGGVGWGCKKECLTVARPFTNCWDQKKREENLQLMRHWRVFFFFLFFAVVLQPYGVWTCYSGGWQWHSRAAGPQYQSGRHSLSWKELCSSRVRVCDAQQPTIYAVATLTLCANCR